MESKLFEVTAMYKTTKGSPKFKANGRVLFANTVEVRFNVVEGTKGLFVSLPTSLGKDGKYYDEVKVPDEATRTQLQKHILEMYNSGSFTVTKPKETTEVDGLPF